MTLHLIKKSLTTFKRLCAVTTSTLLLFVVSCQKQPSLTGRNFSNRTTSVVQDVRQGTNVNDLGIFGDGSTDNTDKIQAALTDGVNLFFPDGDYVVSRTIQLGSNDTITGTDKSRFVIGAAPLDQEFFFFTATSKSNILLSNLSFLGREKGGIDYQYLYAVYLLSSKNINISRLNCNLAGIVKTQVTGVAENDYNNITFATQANDYVTIDNCIGVGLQNPYPKSTDGLTLKWINHWSVSNTNLKGYYNGLTWWGGDSFPGNDGAVENERKCANGVVDHVHVENVFASGIWGSMGTNIVVTNSYVNNAGDLGVNFEGCTNSRATGDTSRNSQNGALSAYFYCNGIVFDQNIVETDDPSKSALLGINTGPFQQKGWDNVSFTNNLFKSINGFGFLHEVGTVENLKFSNNTLVNSIIDFTTDGVNLNDRITISDNNFSITLPLLANVYPINAGRNRDGSQLSILNNNIQSSMPQPGAAIRITQGVFDVPENPDNQVRSGNVTSTVTGNVVSGFRSYALITWGMFGITSTVNISSSTSGPPITSDQIARDGDGNQSASFISIDGQPL